MRWNKVADRTWPVYRGADPTERRVRGARRTDWFSYQLRYYHQPEQHPSPSLWASSVTYRPAWRHHQMTFPPSPQPVPSRGTNVLLLGHFRGYPRLISACQTRPGI